MKRLKRQKGKIWVNETKRMVRYSVYYNADLYPNTPNEWVLEDEADGLALDAVWQQEDEQKRAQEEGLLPTPTTSESPESSAPQA